MALAFNPLSLLNLKCRGRTIAVLRDECQHYDSVLAVARRKFRSLHGVPVEDIVLLATIPGYPETDEVELSKEIWPTVSAVVHSVTIVLESAIVDLARSLLLAFSEMRTTTEGAGLSPALPDYQEMLPLPAAPPPAPPASSPLALPVTPPLSLQPRSRGAAPSGQSRPPSRERPQPSNDVMQTIKVAFSSLIRPTPDPLEISETGLLGKKISHLYDFITSKVGYSSVNSALRFGGTYLDTNLTLADYNAMSGDTIQVDPGSRPANTTLRAVASRSSLNFENLVVRKPVIYLFPPSSLPDVTIELQLASSWRFSAVHPPPRTTVPPGKPHTAQSLTWTIAAEPDGTLVDKTSGTEVSYLYWEANANAHLVTPNASRATTPVEDIETFDPSRPSVSPEDSILLPIGEVPGYLDATLKALALHTEARTSFITYWLPDLLKHQHVALRFLAQASYEKAAQMRVSPAPDVVTRVFMLFRGVDPGDLGLWAQAAARATAEDGATFWAHVVGVDAARGSDRGLFRVLEWGGMEIERRV